MDNIYNRKTFAKNLTYYMKKNRKKQMDLVNDLGFTKSAISSWCTGARLPRMEKLQVLAEYLGIEQSKLIEVNSEKNDLFKLLENIKILLKTQDNLFLEGKPISKESCQLILDAMQVGIEMAKARNNVSNEM